jgi:hypothetical protein
MAVETIFSSVLFTQYILPFLLVFVLVFAILDKTKILGEGKRQINAIVSLVIALVFVSFASAVGIVVKLMPFLAVVLVIVLVFYLMMGFIWNEKEGFNPPKFVKIAGAIIAFIALIVAVLIVTGYWDNFLGLFSGEGKTASSVVMIVIVVAAVAAIVFGGKKD